MSTTTTSPHATTMRTRRASDVASGLELRAADYPGFSDAAVARHFEMFKTYDSDSSGFITPENLLEVLQTLGVECNIDSAYSMIDEVAALTGHVNDGKLSFRDFMNMAFHDKAAAEEPAEEEADSDESPLGTTMATPEADEPESPVGAPASAPRPEARARRRSSLSALNALASGRIQAFQQVARETAEREKNLSALKKQPVQVAGPMVNSDEMHMETLQNKLKAFEVAAHHKGTTEVRKTWKKVGGSGNYSASQKILIGGMPTGVAPKKKLSELP